MVISETSQRVTCPSCDAKAKKVSTVTMGALLKDENASPFLEDDPSHCVSSEDCSPIVGNTGWRFCDSVGCDIAYFSEDEDVAFTKRQLKVDVGVKETSGQRPLCYCFGHSIASIKHELESTGHTDSLADIRAKMKNPGCHCETENPSGSCCLGSVSNGIQIARQELAHKR